MPAPFRPHGGLYVIEVTTEEGAKWFAAASTHEGILRELNSAPICHTIIIHHWQLHQASNPREFFSRFPWWEKVEEFPWSGAKMEIAEIFQAMREKRK